MGTPTVVASECFSGLFPQNTLAGFRQCLVDQVPAIEFDVHLTADNEVVVQHDYRLNPRTTRDADGRFLDRAGPSVRELSLVELQQFDVGRYAPGSREAAEYPDYQPLDNEPPPSLRSFFTEYQEHRATAQLWVELKTSPWQRDISSPPQALLQAVLDLAAGFDVVDRVVMLAFEWDVLVAAQTRSPGIRTNFLTLNPGSVIALNRKSGAVDPAELHGRFRPAAYNNDVVAAILAAGGDWWGPYVGDVTGVDVARARQAGLKVNLWGVDSTPGAMDAAIATGADAITVARPDLLLARLQ